MMKNWYQTWKTEWEYRKRFSRPRDSFYELAVDYLPKDPQAVILDIGSGDGSFLDHLKLRDKYTRLYPLEGNPVAVEALKTRYPETVHYIAPEPLPFDDHSVSMVHCSHLIEHLKYPDLIRLLKEIDRVLDQDGILMVSTPILWDGFYDNMDHIKPYNPTVIINCLCQEMANPSFDPISERFRVEKLVFRYGKYHNEPFRTSEVKMVDFLLHVSRRIDKWLKIKWTIHNAYTLILRKS